MPSPVATASGSKFVDRLPLTVVKAYPRCAVVTFLRNAASSTDNGQRATSIQIHRIDERLVRLVGALHRFLEFLFEDAAAVLLALEVLVETLRGLGLLRLEVRDHRFERRGVLRILRLVQQHFTVDAIDHDRRFAARAGDFEVRGHGAAPGPFYRLDSEVDGERWTVDEALCRRRTTVLRCLFSLTRFDR